MMYALAAVVLLFAVAFGALFPSVPWFIWFVLGAVCIPFALWSGPSFILWVRGFRNHRLGSELGYSSLRRSYRIALAPRAYVEYVSALTLLPYFSVWVVEAVPEFREWLGTDAATVCQLVSDHGKPGDEVETLNRLMASGITDFERLRAYTEELGLDVALLAVGDDMPLEYARAVYPA